MIALPIGIISDKGLIVASLTAKSSFLNQIKEISMLKNYFKIAFRNLRRNRSYTIINIAGLAIGIAVCMVIFFIIPISNELR